MSLSLALLATEAVISWQPYIQMLVVTCKIYLGKFLERKKNNVEWTYKEVLLKDILFPAWGDTISPVFLQSISVHAPAKKGIKSNFVFCWGISELITLFVQLLLWCLLTLFTEFQISASKWGKKIHFQLTCRQYLSDKAELKGDTSEKSLLLKKLKSRGSSSTGDCRAHHYQNKSAWSSVAQSFHSC